MAVIKCKMCGGDLILVADSSTAECAYCGSVQTVPKVDDEKKLVQFERAERLRKQCEFDKAAGIYETIVADFREEAEAYWGLVLCKFGIEYVDDPATGKKIPTCHRSSFDSIMDDSDFEQALENADPMARRVYRDEAKVIEEIRKRIISVSASEEPYDIFICYKETDEKGDRTLDSVLAQDIYDALTGKGYRVFFSRISLEDKLGVEYEPYIFAALNSAKLMLVVGTDYEHFTAVWVKNEWSRFLKLMSKDKDRYLIPCYKNVDAYDMPKEFAKLQAQDLGKLGAVQDILRGVEKLLPHTLAKSVPSSENHPTIASLLKRLFMFLEDGDWNSADEYSEKVLDIDPECGRAYLGKLMVELRVCKEEQLEQLNTPFDDNHYYQKALRFADEPLRTNLIRYAKAVADKKQQGYSVCEKREEEERIAKQKRAEEERLARQQREERERIARQQREEEERIVRQKREAELRALREKREAEELAVRNKQLEKERIERERREEEERIAEENAGRLAAIREKWSAAQRRLLISQGHAVGLLCDGTVRAAGIHYDGRCDVSKWRDIVAISVGTYHTVGLKLNGTVVCVGDNEQGRCNVDSWQNVVSVAAGRGCTIGVLADGTIVSVGVCEDVTGWCNITTIDADADVIVGLKSDGTVNVAGDLRYVRPDGTVSTEGDFRYVHCNTKEWRNIVSVSAGGRHVVGLRHNGMVVVTGDNYYGQCDVDKWRECVAVSAGTYHTVALKADGTVLAVGLNENGQCDVDAWSDIVAVYAGDRCTVGVQSNGTVLAQGDGEFVDEIRQWRLFHELKELTGSYDLSCEYIQRRKNGVCQHCGGTFKGLFFKTCPACGKPKDY